MSIIAMIVVPITVNEIRLSKEIAYKQQIQYIKIAASKWLDKNSDISQENNTCISLNVLRQGKYFSTEIINPKIGKPMEGFVIFSYNDEYEQFDINYAETCE